MCYRYRTAALVGPWRNRREDAVADALRAGQACRDDGLINLRWIIPGRIEAEPRRRVAVNTFPQTDPG